MAVYDDMFSSQKVKCAQVLLTYANLGVEAQYRSSRKTFESLFEMGVVPIVNENDPVADAYTKFGDNDTLSAMIAILVSAERLYLLTDVDGLYTSNPNTDPSAKIIPVVKSMDDLVGVSTSSSGSQWGTGIYIHLYVFIHSLSLSLLRSSYSILNRWNGNKIESCRNCVKLRCMYGRDECYKSS
jgi:glutamate 5-kinase